MNLQLSWGDAIGFVVEGHCTRTAAEKAVALVPQDELRDVIVRHLLECARERRRVVSLREERKAEATHKADRASIERQVAIDYRRSVGLPDDATPSDVVTLAIAQYTAAIKMQWTADLLKSTFSLEGGAQVSWGEATAAQHRERLAMFSSQAELNLNGAARHSAAIAELAATGATCLNEVRERAA